MASKITDATINFIRSVFGREQQKQELSVSGRELAKLAARYGGQLPGIDVSGVLSGDLFSLDKRRLYRYVDYEEMDLYPEISSALDIYSDDSTQTDSTTNKSIWIECNDEKIRKDLDDMFYKRLIIEEKIWPWTRNLCKYGDDFEEIIVSDGEGVIDLSFLPTPTMWKVENDHGDGLGYVQSFSQNFSIDIKKFEELTKKGIDGGAKVNEQSDIAIFDNWRVCHTRLLSKHREAIYGMGVAEPARWIWKRLTLLEDAVMVFKLTRSPSRYAFYVDVTGTSNQQADRAIQDVVNRIKKKKFVDPNTGKLNLKFSPLAFDEDFFLGVRDGKESVRVDSLNGPNYQQIEDVQYFLNKLYAALKIPKAYLGYEENLPSKATLSSEDIRYGRTVLRIQRELRNGLRKIANVHLAARKIDPASVDFEIMMTVPSSISELGQMEIRRARADLANSMQAHVSLYWLLSNVYGMSDDEIQKISQQKKEEQKMAAAGGGGRFGGFESVAGKGRPITEQELMRGNREHEKRIEEIVRSEFEKSNTKIGAQLRETGLLVRDILRASQR